MEIAWMIGSCHSQNNKVGVCLSGLWLKTGGVVVVLKLRSGVEVAHLGEWWVVGGGWD